MLVDRYLLVSGAEAEGLGPRAMAIACVLHHFITAILRSCVLRVPDKEWLLMCRVQGWGPWNVYFSPETSGKCFLRFEAARDNQLLSRDGEQEGEFLSIITSLRGGMCLSSGLKLVGNIPRIRELASISMQVFPKSFQLDLCSLCIPVMLSPLTYFSYFARMESLCRN